ncbi:MAG: hypothetical protein PHN39_00280 [Candidatus Pacebacteria bacterium]|nr:hypothetical protein [Candidatus Paceibacterota bacterium]
MKNFLIVVLIFFSLLVCSLAQAVSLKVSPAALNINGQANVLIQKEIEITNPDNKVALFEVYPDSFSEIIKARPESFVLEGGQSKKVAITIKSREAGVFATYLSVVAKPLVGEPMMKANSGVKIPLQIILDERNGPFLLAALASFWQGRFTLPASLFLLAIAVVSLFWLFLKKKSSKI